MVADLEHVATMTNPYSLDATYEQHDDEVSLGDILADETAEEAYALVDERDSIERMLSLFRRELSPHEARILRWRLGIDCEMMTLQEIGDRLGVSRERIRQVEAVAKSKLRKVMREATVKPVPAPDPSKPCLKRPAGWYNDERWNPMVACACGCGQMRRQYDRQSRFRPFFSGHDKRVR
jgi:hypothetical protein